MQLQLELALFGSYSRINTEIKRVPHTTFTMESRVGLKRGIAIEIARSVNGKRED